MGGWGYLLLALLLRPAACSEPETVTDVIGAVGKSVTFRIPGPIKNRLFWHVKNLLMVIVNSTGYLEVLDAEYRGRMSFSNGGTALTLSGLVPEDAGTYSGQINTKTRFVFHLQVFAELPPPAVTCSRQNCSAAPCTYELRCSAPGPGVSYGWSGPPGLVLNTSGPLLELREERPLRDLLPVTCTARNPVSSSNVTVQLAAVCTENASRTPISGVSPTTYIATGVAVLVVVLLVVVGICCFHRCQRILSWPVHPSPGTDVGTEALTVYAQVGPSKQGPAQAKKAPAPAGENSRTIYSTVQHTAQPQTDDEKMGSGAAAPGEKSLYATVNAVPGLHGALEPGV